LIPNLKILDLANNKIGNIEPLTFTNMSKLQILDLSGNLLKILPSSIGTLCSLRTLLLGGNPFDESIESLTSPLIRCYDNMLPFNREREIYASPLNQKILQSRHPGQGYLLRLQGYLTDSFELEMGLNFLGNTVPRDKVHVPVLDLEYFMVPTHFIDEELPRRSRVITELIGTELTYVRELNILVDIYKNPLKKMGLLTDAEFDILFSNVSDILLIHSRYYLFLC
jgi:hypothetical protein